MSFAWPTMLLMKKLMRMHNKETYTHMCEYWHTCICKIGAYNKHMCTTTSTLHLSELHWRYVAYDLKFFVQDVWMKVDCSFCLGLVRLNWSHNGYSIHIFLSCRLMYKLISISQYWLPVNLVFMVSPDEWIYSYSAHWHFTQKKQTDRNYMKTTVAWNGPNFFWDILL